MVDQTRIGGKSPVPSLVKVAPYLFAYILFSLIYLTQVQPLLKKSPEDVENHSTSVVRWIIWIGETMF